MSAQFLIVGGGIGGLAAALTLAQRSHRIELLEQASTFSEVGAGIQLGPNVTRRLQAIGLGEAVDRVAVRPGALLVRRAADGTRLARMPLAGSFEHRYGAPYVCIHRADLHALLLAAVRQIDQVNLSTSARVTEVAVRGEAVCVAMADKRAWEGDALIGADGVWGGMRAHMIEQAPPPRYTGHTAWRALAPVASLPAALRSTDVQVWLGPRLHAVAYPVRAGEQFNVVVIAESPPLGDPRDWDQAANREALMRAIGSDCDGVRPLIDAMPAWRTWALNGRAPVAGPHEMAGERIALMGDAAHPMVPYLAQGAGMAIEDAVTLADMVDDALPSELPPALARYAAARWERAAHVQKRAWRNGQIFHATGALCMARDLTLRLFGAQVMDVPWLYRG